MLCKPMASPAPARVFISYARKDGADLARRLEADLKRRGFDPWLDTQRFSGGATWTRDIEVALDEADYVLALLTHGSYASEICRSEQLRALRKGTCVIPLKAQSDTDIPLHLEAKNYRDFSQPTQYDAQFEALLRDFRGNVSATLPERYRSTPIRYLTAPPRVANYLERPEALRALRDVLFAEDHHQPVALTALAGMGGIGKTVLAKALTEDEVVQRAFPDGIVWITAGKEGRRDFIEEMREVAKALGDDLSGYDTPLACENRYRTTIAQKAALIVVDDVWSKADIEPLLAESPRSRFLFTTRDASIGRFVAAREHRADLLDVRQSRELLALWVNLPVAELPVAANDLIAECGWLPLAISVIGGLLRGAETALWQDTLDLLRKADFTSIEEQLPEGQQSFFKAIQISYQALKPEMQERYRSLAVLLEDMPASLPILRTLWKVNEPEARRIARQFVDRSLAQQDSDRLRLHDLQVDYIRALHANPKVLNLIHQSIRLSAHVIARRPNEFASQLVGRLLPYMETPGMQRFIDSLFIGAPRPWLRPIRPALHPPGGPLVRTLGGHSWVVNAVAVTPDGRRAVSASWDNSLKLWDLESGRALRTLEGHAGAVNCVALTNDGRRAVSGSSDNTLKVWDLESGRALTTLEGHSAGVRGVALTPDGSCAVSASDDRTLKVWDLERASALRTLEGHSGPVNAVAVTPDGRLAISASEDTTLKVWDLDIGRTINTLKGHDQFLNSVAVSPDGRRVVSASDDRTLKVWDLGTGSALRTLKGHLFEANSAALTPDGQRVVSASSDGTLKIWDMETGRELSALEGHSDRVNGVAVTPDGRRAVSASWDQTLKVWDLEADNPIEAMDGHRWWINSLAITSDRRRVVTASHDNTLKLWDLQTGRVLRTFSGHSDRVNGVAVTPDGRRAVSASWDRMLKVWDLESGKMLMTLTGHRYSVLGVALTPDGKCAVSASWDNTLKVWELETGNNIRTLGGDSEVLNVAVTPDGRRIVSASEDRTLTVWDLKSGRSLRVLEGHSDSVNFVAVTPDGCRAISASSDNTLMVWDLDTGVAIKTLEGHSHRVRGVAISSDGRHAVSVSDDKTLKIWNLDAFTELVSMTGDARTLCCAFISGSKFVVGDALGRLHWLEIVDR
jgi:WD40 repeat protein